MTIKITQLGNLTGVYGNTIIPVVANIAGDWTTVKGNLTQFGAYINQAELPYGNIIPAADAVYSLGTASYRFKDLYLLGSTIYLGNATISISNAAVVTSLPLTAPSVTVGNTVITASGNISVNSISVTDEITAANITAAGLLTATDITTSGTLTATDITTSGTLTAGDVTTTGNITAADVTTSGTLTAGDVTATGVITAANIEVSGNTITLGSATLDVSSGSLESSIPIVADITSTSNLTMQGTRIEFSQGAYIVEEEVFGSPGEYALTLTSAEDGIVGLNAMDANANITSSVVVSNVAVQLNVANIDPMTGNVNVWYYDNNGGVIFPDSTRQDTAYDPTTAYSNVQVSNFLPTYSTGNIGVISLTPTLVSVLAPMNVGFPSPVNFANVIILGTNDVDSYAQLNVQNLNTVGNLVSADFIATAPNGTDSTHYIDLGINGNNYSSGSWTISGPNDGYLYINQGNLTVGTDTANTTVSVHIGGLLAENIVTTFSSTELTVDANLVINSNYVPSLANSAGTAGSVVWDTDYVYICVATDTWKRANISTW